MGFIGIIWKSLGFWCNLASDHILWPKIGYEPVHTSNALAFQAQCHLRDIKCMYVCSSNLPSSTLLVE